MSSLRVRLASLALSITALAALPSAASADVGPPPSCPAGLTGSYWMGHYCGVIACTSDDQCGGQKCTERSVCIDNRGQSATQYAGECSESAACGSGKCTPGKYCTVASDTAPAQPSATPSSTAVPTIPPGALDKPLDTTGGSAAPPPRRGCACSFPGDASPIGALAVTALGAALLVRGRRRRDRG